MKANVYKKLYAATKTKGIAFSNLCGAIYHHNGYLLSTDSYMLCKIKHDYNENLECRIFHSDGKEIMRKYYPYSKFFEKIDSMEHVYIPDLLAACNNIVRAKDRRTYAISVGNIVLKANRVVNVYNLLGKRTELYFTKESKGCIFSKGDDMVYMCEISDPSPYTIDDALSLVFEK